MPGEVDGQGPQRAHRRRRADRPVQPLSTIINAPYVGEKSVESGRILGKMIVDKLGGADAKGTVIIGICFPGFPVLENRAQGRAGIAEGGRPA